MASSKLRVEKPALHSPRATGCHYDADGSTLIIVVLAGVRKYKLGAAGGTSWAMGCVGVVKYYLDLRYDVMIWVAGR